MVDYKYFMDELQPYEITTLSRLVPWSNKQNLEQTRLIMWSALAPYSKQKQTPEKVLPLYTDRKITEPERRLSNDEADDIRKQILANFEKHQHN